MLGITLRAAGPAEPFWELVDALSVLETEPTIRPLGYAPHITLTRFPDVDPDHLKAALAVFDGETAFTLAFDGVRAFEGEETVLWLAPRPDRRLIDAHARLNAMIDTGLSDPHYRPGAWTPHLTVATAIPAARRAEADRIIERGTTSFALCFETVDCLSWPPVTVLAERALT